MMVASSMLRNGEKNRKNALQYYASRNAFLNFFLVVLIILIYFTENANA